MKVKTRRYYIYYLLKVLFFVISRVPLRVSLAMAGFFGSRCRICGREPIPDRLK